MKMSYRQASIIIFYMLVAFKVLSLPSLMYQTCKNDGYLAVFIMMLVDAVLIWASLKILKQAKDKNIYDFIKQYNITNFELLTNLEDAYDSLALHMEEKFVCFIFEILQNYFTNYANNF